MLVVTGISLILWLVIVPSLIGRNFRHKKQSIDLEGYFREYLFGLVCIFSLFEVIAVPLTFLKSSLKSVTILWVNGCVILGAIGILRRRIHIRPIEWKIKFQMKNVMGYGAFAIIVYQIIYVVTHMHIDDDDAWYVGTAVTSYFTDTINRVYPYTGELMNSFPADYTLSPYPIFYAMLGKITFVHPTILMHTLIPIVLIAASYMVYYLIASRLFDGRKRDISCFMLFISIFNIFGNFSVRSVSTFTLFRIWQGKATLCSIIVPLAVYVFILCMEEKRKKYWIAEFLVVLAGTMVSSMGVFLMPVLLGAMALVMMERKRNIKIGMNAFVCILPCIVQFTVYYLVLR